MLIVTKTCIWVCKYNQIKWIGVVCGRQYLGSPSCSGASSSSSSLPLYSYSVSSKIAKNKHRILHRINTHRQTHTVCIHTLLSPLLAGAVDVIFELDAHLSLVRLVSDERVLQQLLRGRPLSVVLHQTAFNKVKELLGPEKEKDSTDTQRKY